MAALRDKSDKELAQYNMEIKELTRVLEHDRKLKSFMTIKGQERKVGCMCVWMCVNAFLFDRASVAEGYFLGLVPMSYVLLVL